MALSGTSVRPTLVGKSNTPATPAQAATNPADKLDTWRAELAKRRANPVSRRYYVQQPGVDPWQGLREFGRFRVYDFMEAFKLSRAHAIVMMRRLVIEGRIQPWILPGWYEIAPKPPRALVPYNESPRMFADRFIQAIKEQHAPSWLFLLGGPCPF